MASVVDLAASKAEASNKVIKAAEEVDAEVEEGDGSTVKTTPYLIRITAWERIDL